MRAPGLSFALPILLSAFVVAPSVLHASDVRITMRDGRVSIIATEATLPEILAEWARVGGTTIINGEAAKGGPITVELTDVPENEALSVLLRSSGGYVAIGRRPQSTGVSRFDRIQIMQAQVVTAQAVTAASPRPVPSAVPVFQPSVPLPPEFATQGVTRIIGPSGLPLPDDQDGAPPFAPAPGTRAPGVIVPAPQPAQAPPQPR
jgi:hypothetical protein